jgi:hypothetical protein
MKKIKTFEKFQEDDIYTLIEFIEQKSEKLDSESDDFTGSYINYNIIDNDTLEIDLGWNSPEEFMNLESIIKFEDDKITLKGKQEGSSVYSEDGKNYENDYDESFDNVEELIKFLDNEI